MILKAFDVFQSASHYLDVAWAFTVAEHFLSSHVMQNPGLRMCDCLVSGFQKFLPQSFIHQHCHLAWGFLVKEFFFVWIHGRKVLLVSVAKADMSDLFPISKSQQSAHLSKPEMWILPLILESPMLSLRLSSLTWLAFHHFLSCHPGKFPRVTFKNSFCSNTKFRLVISHWHWQSLFWISEFCVPQEPNMCLTCSKKKPLSKTLEFFRKPLTTHPLFSFQEHDGRRMLRLKERKFGNGAAFKWDGSANLLSFLSWPTCLETGIISFTWLNINVLWVSCALCVHVNLSSKAWCSIKLLDNVTLELKLWKLEVDARKLNDIWEFSSLSSCAKHQIHFAERMTACLHSGHSQWSREMPQSSTSFKKSFNSRNHFDKNKLSHSNVNTFWPESMHGFTLEEKVWFLILQWV